MKSEPSFSNSLNTALSPYLLQHAHQPVAWQEWNECLFAEAEKQSKLLIVSIGYSSCHWCHVMAHESFEDSKVAAFMNTHFISIKVDREERPDVDRLYMQSLQMLTGQGGWPLNIVALPDGRPLWGCTYLKKEQWTNALKQLIDIKTHEPKKLTDQADLVINGLKAIQEAPKEKSEGLSRKEITAVVYRMLRQIDTVYGGFQGTPKFMMPVLLDFWQEAKAVLGIEAAKKHYLLTLKRMAQGGLYDTLGGGFSRYSVDDRWHIPHFEKMGYDNGLLLSTYSRAYADDSKTLYRTVVAKTIHFLKTELRHPDGGFYASLDADSPNAKGQIEEGAYYSWTFEELKNLITTDFDTFCAYYNIREEQLWEGNRYVFWRSQSDIAFCETHALTLADLEENKKTWHKELLYYRNTKPKPALDDKCITSWNALICSGLLEAYKVFREEDYKILAEQVIDFIGTHLTTSTGGLYRIFKDGHYYLPGLAEDFATAIQMYLNAYEVLFEAEYLERAQSLMSFFIENFSLPNTVLFSFTSRMQAPLHLTQIDVQDDVIPSSNAIMAENLMRLGAHFSKLEWKERAHSMILEMGTTAIAYPESHSKWLSTALWVDAPPIEIVVTGPDFKEVIRILQQYSRPHIRWAGCATESTLPLLKNRLVPGKTLIYWCENQICSLPETDRETILAKLKFIAL